MIQKILIIDDELDSCNLMRSYLNRYFPHLFLCPYGHNVVEGVQHIEENKPDIVLLDIQLEDGTGFNVLDHFPNPLFRVIFVTAYDEFALKAFKYNAIDYLLKPIDPDEFKNAIKKVLEQQMPEWFSNQLKSLMSQNKSGKLDKITFSTQKEIVSINLEDILRIEGEGNYTTVHSVDNDNYVISKSLKEIESLLPGDQFCRVHQSHMINIKSVKKYIKQDGGYAVLENGVKIPISRRKKDLFLKMFTLDSSH